MNNIVNSSSCVVIWMSSIFFIQLQLVSSVWTLLFLNLAILYSSSTKSLGAAPWSHLASQNGVLFPLSICIMVEEKKMLLLDLSDTFRRFSHGLALRSQSCQSHLILRALLNLSKSFIPKPPHLLGLKHVCQLIRQRPPLALSGSSPFHRKLILNLSIL
jgi:hypothetical protein